MDSVQKCSFLLSHKINLPLSVCQILLILSTVKICEKQIPKLPWIFQLQNSKGHRKMYVSVHTYRDRQTSRQAKRQTDRQAGKETEAERYTHIQKTVKQV